MDLALHHVIMKIVMSARRASRHLDIGEPLRAISAGAFPRCLMPQGRKARGRAPDEKLRVSMGISAHGKQRLIALKKCPVCTVHN